ncbi:NAD-dependent epimerase/dehydratase family protein [Sulfurospirillum sp. 1307]|jgi:nucleoside-diphosphate-sugar epimerase
MNNVLIIGGKGYIGQHMKKIFPNAIYTNSKDFDLTKKDEIKNFITNINIDFCIILSSKITFNKKISIDSEPFLTNVEGLNNLLATFTELRKYPKIIYFSSMTVYDKNAVSPVKETSVLKPIHDYGLSKVFAENIINFYNFNSVIIRIPGVFGGSRTDGFIYNTITKLIKNEYININTSNIGYWETIYIEDLIVLLKKFFEIYDFKRCFDIFNFSYGTKTDLIETAFFLKKELKSSSKIAIKKEYSDLYLSNEKLNKYIDININYFSSLKKYVYLIKKNRQL